MNEAKFWKVIEKIDWDAEDEDEAIEPAVEALAAQSAADIRRFEDILAVKLHALDAEAYARNMGKYRYGTKRFSPDLFLYARCFVVAQGKAFYGKVLSNPKEMPDDEEFEILLELAATAYEEKTGEEFDHTSEVDYETFSNDEGWADVSG